MRALGAALAMRALLLPALLLPALAAARGPATVSTGRTDTGTGTGIGDAIGGAPTRRAPAGARERARAAARGPVPSGRAGGRLPCPGGLRWRPKTVPLPGTDSERSGRLCPGAPAAPWAEQAA